MFGCDFNPAYLLSTSKIELEEDNTITSEDDSPVYMAEDHTYNLPANSNEWVEDIDSQRISQQRVARANIKQEQARQKVLILNSFDNHHFPKLYT